MTRAARVAAALACSLLSLASRAGAESRSSGCEADTIAKGDRQERSIDVDGVSRAFILDVPATVAPHEAVPLLLDFHGFRHSAEGVWRVSGFRELGVREHFLTVYPQGLEVELLGSTGAGWEMFSVDGNRDIAFVRHLLDQIEEQYCIDRSRVFVTGFSNGAFLSHLLACVLSDRIAAIAPVGGGAVNLACAPGRPVSVLIHHGRNDPVVDVAQAQKLFALWKKIDACPGERKAVDKGCTQAVNCGGGTAVVYCENDGEHRWPPDATQRIWNFFKQHPMTAP